MNKLKLTLVLSALIGCKAYALPSDALNALNSSKADAVYFGGDILTMVGEQPSYAEALAVKDGKIAFVGSLKEAQNLVGEQTKKISLDGKTLMPGFIDAHGHMVYFGKNLLDADLFGVKSVAILQEKMKKHLEQVPDDAWVVGFGYSAREMEEGRHPTAAELDAISPSRPIMIVDKSGHHGAINTVMMKLLHLDASTQDPQGGKFERKEDGKELLGHLEETALNLVRAQRPAFTEDLSEKALKKAADVWASYGQTTAMEAGLGLGNDDIDIVKVGIERKALPIDLVLYAKESHTDQAINAAYSIASEYNEHPEHTLEKTRLLRPDLDKRYINHIRLAGIKLWLDGSLDTAWMSESYAHPPAGQDTGYKSYQQITNKVVDDFFDKYWATDMQINMHMNGDAAADQALTAIDKAIKKYGYKDHRPVFIHATYLRKDQIDHMKRVGAIPSFLSVGLVDGGLAAEHLWGKERAEEAMATQSFLDKGMKFTLSHDAPVTPSPAVLPLVWAAVNRQMSNGVVIGPEQRISAYDALKAVTSMAAYQIKEEKSKGTLEKEKLADFVILSENPIKVEKDHIKDIQVLETIKEGRQVYQKK
ncbi:amidohydrolase [Hydromonas duriensis]|uniref:amidohydrolase n=1 Tax=Hydromonas duriensis TaxID=1527608 RepID=UPI0013C2E409|nr:amidohydrolase [Hydromonas duriensis]